MKKPIFLFALLLCTNTATPQVGMLINRAASRAFTPAMEVEGLMLSRSMHYSPTSYYPYNAFYSTAERYPMPAAAAAGHGGIIPPTSATHMVSLSPDDGNSPPSNRYQPPNPQEKPREEDNPEDDDHEEEEQKKDSLNQQGAPAASGYIRYVTTVDTHWWKYAGIFLLLYWLVSGYALMRVFRKVRFRLWTAWIPVIRLVGIMQLARLPNRLQPRTLIPLYGLPQWIETNRRLCRAFQYPSSWKWIGVCCPAAH